MQGFHYLTLSPDTRIDLDRADKGHCHLRLRGPIGQTGAATLIMSDAQALDVARLLERHLRDRGVVALKAPERVGADGPEAA